MGIWSDDGIVWLPRSRYATATSARLFAMREWGCTFLDVRVLSRWMRYEPFVARHADGSIAWQEDMWSECGRDEPGAFRVWRLE